MEAMEYKMSSHTLKRQDKIQNTGGVRPETSRQIRLRTPGARCDRPVRPQTVLRRGSSDGSGYELCCPVEHEAKAWEYFSCWVEYSDTSRILPAR